MSPTRVKKMPIILISLAGLLVVIGAVAYLYQYATDLLLEKKIHSSADLIEQQLAVELAWEEIDFHAPDELLFSGLTISRGRMELHAPHCRVSIGLFKLLGILDGGELIRKVSIDHAKFIYGDTPPADSPRLPIAPAKSGTKEGKSRSGPPDRLRQQPPELPFSRIWKLVETAASSQYLPKELVFEGEVETLKDGDRSLVFPGPLSVSFSPRRDRERIVIRTEGYVNSSLSLDYGNRDMNGRLLIAEVESEELSEAFLPIEDHIRAGNFRLEADFRIPSEREAEISGTISSSNMAVAHPVFGPDPVSGIDLTYRFTCSYNLAAPLPPPKVLGKNTPSNPSLVAAGQQFSATESEQLHGEILFSRGELDVEGVEIDILPALRGMYARAGDIPPGQSSRLELSIQLPKTKLQRAVKALPRELIGPFEGIELDGSAAWDFYLEIPLDRIAEMNWRSEVELEGFELKKIPTGLNIFLLDDEFCYAPEGFSESSPAPLRIPKAQQTSMEWMRRHSELSPGVIRRLRERSERSPAPPSAVGTGRIESHFGTCTEGYDRSYRYVYLDQMSPHIPLAVITAEDGDFFFHDGINWHTIRQAIESNLRSRKIESGGSTITMQLVKNLFLSKSRSLRRKLHEAVLVYLIEEYARIPKERILEVYLNIADFGPGVRGINEACRYYFDKSPSELDPVEAVWLASILPSPRKYHRYFEAGKLSKGWWIRLHYYLELMRERERLTEEDYLRAMRRGRLFRNADGGGG